MFWLFWSPAGGCAGHGIGLFIFGGYSNGWENEFNFFDLLLKEHGKHFNDLNND